MGGKVRMSVTEATPQARFFFINILSEQCLGKETNI